MARRRKWKERKRSGELSIRRREENEAARSASAARYHGGARGAHQLRIFYLRSKQAWRPQHRAAA